MQTNIASSYRNHLNHDWPTREFFPVPVVDEDIEAVRASGPAPLHRHAARLRLELAETPAERQQAVALASEAGMPLWEIQDYLDWLDVVRVYEAESKSRGSQNSPTRGWLIRKLRVLGCYVQGAPSESVG
jgi:hypothetical protein